MRRQTSGNLALDGFNDIFQSTAPIVTMPGESIVNLPIEDLFPPEFHPFQVSDDEAMTRLVKSVKQYGVREPGLVRPRAEGGYELLAGNRRRRACEIAGISSLPVIIREMDDDSAAIAMVDSNLEQREKLLPSEKAWAYRVKLEALNHRGTKTDNPGQLSVDILCEQTGECKNTIFRLIRLTELIPDLIDKVDARQLALYPAVELSYLTRIEQAQVVDCMARYEVKPSLSHSQRLKKASQDNKLTLDAMEAILTELKKAAPQPAISGYKRFFPNDYTPEQIDAVITGLLREWQASKARV